MGAIALKQPLLQIDAKEARMLADGVIEVGKQHAVTINPKLLAWGQLLGAICAVHAPRFIMLMAMKPKQPPPRRDGGQPSGQPQQQPSPTPSNVQPIFGGGERPLGSDIPQGPMKFG